MTRHVLEMLTLNNRIKKDLSWGNGTKKDVTNNQKMQTDPWPYFSPAKGEFLRPKRRKNSKFNGLDFLFAGPREYVQQSLHLLS